MMMREVQTMKFENRDTKMFMELVRDLVAARYTYLLPVNEYYKVDPGKTLLGYYDSEYVYLVPSVLIGMCNDYTAIVGDRPRDSKTFSYAAHFIKLLEWIGFTYVSEYTIDTGRKVLPEVMGSSRYPFTAVPVSRNKQVLIFIKKESSNDPIPCPRCGNKDTKGYGYTKKGDKKWACYNCYSWGHIFYERSIIMNSCKTGENIIPAEMIDKWSRGVVQIAPMFSEESKQRHLFSEVAEMAVMFYSGVGDVVLDPFSGTGSAIMTAVKHKRIFMCFEHDENDRKMFFGALRVLREHLEKVGKETECVSEDMTE